MAGIDVALVQGRSEINAFIDFPWELYEKYPLWAPPLKSVVRRLLDPERHPFWRFSERALFLARRGNRVVGRIAAIVDNNHNRYRNEKAGSWGFFECLNDPDAARALLNEAREWVASKGMTTIRGPLNPSLNYDVGTLVEGFDNPPSIMMPYNPPYYGEMIESAGFRKEKDLISMLIEEADRPSPRVERLARRITRKNHIWMRPMNLKNWDSEIELVARMYKECWSDNWGFVPMTNEEIRDMGKSLALIADPELVVFPYYNDEPAGICVLVPDVNPLLRRLNGKIGVSGLFKILLHKRKIRGLRGMLFGVRKAFRTLGLPLVAMDYVRRVALKKKYKRLEMGWNLEDNEGINQFDKEIGGRVINRYRIYAQDLS